MLTDFPPAMIYAMRHLTPTEKCTVKREMIAAAKRIAERLHVPLEGAFDVLCSVGREVLEQVEAQLQ